MIKKPLQLLLVISLLAPFKTVLAGSYDTLPKGVNTFVFKQVKTSRIESKYDADNKEDKYMLQEEFTSSRLDDIGGAIKSYFDELNSLSPDAYNNFSLGEFKADVYADVSAQGFGYGHGITDRLTVYSSVPVYHIKTDVTFLQTKPSNLSAVQSTLKNTNPTSAFSKFVKDLTLQLPNTNEELLQSVIVNYYGYKPIGRWEKDALGDVELGFIYRLTDFADKGIALSAGSIIPTGEVDDPDSLQDVSTGDGQFDAFVESMAGVSFFENFLQFDVRVRYTYQFSSTKEVRWIESSDVPLANSKRSVREKLGDKIDSSVSITLTPIHWISLSGSMIFGSTGKTVYDNVEDQNVKTNLEKNTSSSNQWAKVGVTFSTVEAYKMNKFYVPFEIGASAQKLVNAKNTANYERFDLDLKLYF